MKLKSTKIIEIEGFIDAKDVPPTLYDAPYYAGPDGPVAVKAFSLLAATLKETKKTGIGKVVLRDREDVVMITPMENGICLYKLRAPHEVRKISEVPQLDGKVIDKYEVDTAKRTLAWAAACAAKDAYKARAMSQAKEEASVIA